MKRLSNRVDKVRKQLATIPNLSELDQQVGEVIKRIAHLKNKIPLKSRLVDVEVGEETIVIKQTSEESERLSAEIDRLRKENEALKKDLNSQGDLNERLAAALESAELENDILRDRLRDASKKELNTARILQQWQEREKELEAEIKWCKEQIELQNVNIMKHSEDARRSDAKFRQLKQNQIKRGKNFTLMRNLIFSVTWISNFEVTVSSDKPKFFNSGLLLKRLESLRNSMLGSQNQYGEIDPGSYFAHQEEYVCLGELYNEHLSKHPKVNSEHLDKLNKSQNNYEKIRATYFNNAQ